MDLYNGEHHRLHCDCQFEFRYVYGSWLPRLAIIVWRDGVPAVILDLGKDVQGAG